MSHRFLIVPAVIAFASGACLGGSTLGYVSDVEPANNSLSGVPIVFPCGGCTSAVATPAWMESGDIDIYRLSVGVGDIITVMTTPMIDMPNSFFDPDTFIEVRNSSNVVVMQNDDAGSDFPAWLQNGSVARYRVTVAGDYTVRILGFPASMSEGPYGFIIARHAAGSPPRFAEGVNDSPATADVLHLSSGPMVVRAVSEPGDADFFAVDMNAGDVLSVVTVPLVNATTPDTILRILDGDGTTALVQNDDAPSGVGEFGSAIRFRAPHSGRFYILQTPFGGAPGAYDLIAHLIPAAPCAGDADGNRLVTFGDITAVLSNFNMICR